MGRYVTPNSTIKQIAFETGLFFSKPKSTTDSGWLKMFQLQNVLSRQGSIPSVFWSALNVPQSLGSRFGGSG